MKNPNDAARPELARAANTANEAGNLNMNSTATASTLFAEADVIAATIPCLLTRAQKRRAVVRLCRTWSVALATSRAEMGG